MTSPSFAGRNIQFDAEGYLADTAQWTPELAEAIARDLGIELTPEHWMIINYAREEFAQRKASPGLRRIVANTSVTMRDLYRMFPKGPGKLIAKIAGIPKPKSCL